MDFRWKAIVFMCCCIFESFSVAQLSDDDSTEFSELYKLYRGCGFIKTCIKICLVSGSPDDTCANCIRRRSCPAIVTISYESGHFHSQMLIRQVSLQNIYVSMGIAPEKSMLNAPYVACVYRPDKQDSARVVMYSGYTAKDYTIVNYFDPTEPSRHIFYNKKVETIDVAGQPRPAFYCEFTWKSEFKIPELPEYTDFNLNSDKYYIIAAIGNAGDNFVADWALGGHANTDNGRVVTEEKSSLTKAKNDDLDYDEDYDCEEAVCGRAPGRPNEIYFLMPTLLLLWKALYREN